MANRGNTGHRGYKMSKVVGVSHDDTRVLLTLECGHVQRWTPGYNETPEYAAKDIVDKKYVIVATTRLRCNESHQEA